MNTILAAPDLLKIEKISFRSDEVRLVVKTWLPKATCPSCGWSSDKAVPIEKSVFLSFHTLTVIWCYLLTCRY